MEVLAAGALCWREEADKLMVAVIHRGRYDDWTFPKGKVDPGESLPEAAVREIREETGLKVKLGVPLETVSYPLDKSKTKVVHYWAAKVSSSAIEKSKFKPNEEVSEVVWLEAKKAAPRLSYQHDRELLQELIDLHESQTLDTSSLVILRHAKATPRSEFPGSEGDRPLLEEGIAQSLGLTKFLSSFAPKRIYSSPWKRCLETVEPYSKKLGLEILLKNQLTEANFRSNPKGTAKLVREIVLEAKSSLVCTHRPVMTLILRTLAEFADPDVAKDILKIPKLSPSDFLVFHLAEDPNTKRQIVAVEMHSIKDRLPAKP
jgi:8-oxo-dGTP pyrophosphatase MutT (NUDIX family)/phosphohistidine phosphatase SixA